MDNPIISDINASNAYHSQRQKTFQFCSLCNKRKSVNIFWFLSCYQSIPNLVFFYCRTKFLRKNPRFILPTQAVACVLSFGIALPFAIALFPQMSQVNDPPFNLHLTLFYYHLSPFRSAMIFHQVTVKPGMDSRATCMHFACLRMQSNSHVITIIPASQLHFPAIKNAKLAAPRCTVEQLYCPFAVLCLGLFLAQRKASLANCFQKYHFDISVPNFTVTDCGL